MEGGLKRRLRSLARLESIGSHLPAALVRLFRTQIQDSTNLVAEKCLPRFPAGSSARVEIVAVVEPVADEGLRGAGEAVEEREEAVRGDGQRQW